MPYKVTFPSGETKEYKNTIEICEDLKVSEYTINSILNNTCSFTHKNTKPLKGIIITSAYNDHIDEHKFQLRQKYKEELMKVKHEKIVQQAKEKIAYYQEIVNKYEKI